MERICLRAFGKKLGPKTILHLNCRTSNLWSKFGGIYSVLNMKKPSRNGYKPHSKSNSPYRLKWKKSLNRCMVFHSSQNLTLAWTNSFKTWKMKNNSIICSKLWCSIRIDSVWLKYKQKSLGKFDLPEKTCINLKTSKGLFTDASFVVVEIVAIITVNGVVMRWIHSVEIRRFV